MTKKIRLYTSFLKKYLNKYKKIILGFLISAVILFLSINFFVPSYWPKITNLVASTNKETFVEGVVGLPRFPNPLFDSTESEKEISKLVYRGLLKIDSDTKLIPDLAQNFKVSRDNKTYTFYLKKNIYWHDGHRFDADDVVYTVKLTQDPNIKNNLSSYFENVDVEKIDGYTVKFVLKDVFIPFPYAATVGIIPEHIPLDRFKPIGTGDFEVISKTTNSILLESDDLFIKFVFYPSFADAKTALKLSEIHGLGGFSPQDIEDIEKFGSDKVYKNTLSYRQPTIFFNTRHELLKNKNIRQALTFAIDKKEISKKVGGAESVVSNHPFIRGTPLRLKSEKYVKNISRAQKLLKEQGYKYQNGNWEKDGKKLKLTIVTADDKELNSIANLVKSYWIDLGIVTKVESKKTEKLQSENISSKQFEVLINFQDFPIDPDQYVLWHTTKERTSNITGIKSPKLDKILEDARKVLDKKERNSQYELFHTLLSDEIPAIFLYYPEYVWLVSDEISGINLSGFNESFDRFKSYKKWQFSNDFLDLLN